MSKYKEQAKKIISIEFRSFLEGGPGSGTKGHKPEGHWSSSDLETDRQNAGVDNSDDASPYHDLIRKHIGNKYTHVNNDDNGHEFDRIRDHVKSGEKIGGNSSGTVYRKDGRTYVHGSDNGYEGIYTSEGGPGSGRRPPKEVGKGPIPEPGEQDDDYVELPDPEDDYWEDEPLDSKGRSSRHPRYGKDD